MFWDRIVLKPVSVSLPFGIGSIFWNGVGKITGVEE